jgi:hypothetical protein
MFGARLATMGQILPTDSEENESSRWRKPLGMMMPRHLRMRPETS